VKLVGLNIDVAFGTMLIMDVYTLYTFDVPRCRIILYIVIFSILLVCW